MSKTIYRYQFDEKIPLQEVEDSLMLAVLAVECLHGRSLIHLDADFLLDKERRTCVVDASTKIGSHIACIFTGFLSREFGEDNFKVERLCDVEPQVSSEPSVAPWTRIPGLFNKREIEQIKEPDKEYRIQPRGTDNWGQEVFALYYKSQGGKGGE